ncbi:hypothetical protein [Mycolicibacterium cosmeticum]|uniref:hypothetical protein n=1 Tax=Mycolicibacterium cosmeticum TaxID=258533 RepID=UPI0032048C1F
MDWPNIVTSAVVGAVSGGLISWLTAPHLKSREARGAARSQARAAIAKITTSEITKVRQYQDHARSSMGRDPDEFQVHSGDVTLCANLMNAAEGLPRWRRYLVRRRLRKLFGPVTVEMCEVHGEYAGNPEASLGILLNRQFNASKDARFSHPDRGEFDRGLRCSPDSREVSNLLKSLGRLRSGR